MVQPGVVDELLPALSAQSLQARHSALSVTLVRAGGSDAGRVARARALGAQIIADAALVGTLLAGRT